MQQSGSMTGVSRGSGSSPGALQESPVATAATCEHCRSLLWLRQLRLKHCTACKQEQPGATRSNQEQPDKTRSNQEHPGSSQEQPGVARGRPRGYPGKGFHPVGSVKCGVKGIPL